jgi:predicted ester cyclase
MDRAVVQQVLDRYYDVLNRRDAEAIPAVVSDQAVFRDDFMPDTVFHGPAEFRGLLEGMWFAFPDMAFEILRGPFFDDATAQCAVYGRIAGTLSNAVPDWGFTNVGATIDQQFMAFYEVTDEKMSFIRVCLNPAVTVGQVGPASTAAGLSG